MADDGSAQSKTVWPLAKFSFRLRLGDWVVAFQEVSGLEAETQVIEYRHGDSAVFSTAKMPGLQKAHHVTLKKGIFAGDDEFWDLYRAITKGKVARENITVELLDENGAVTMAWELKKAYPAKITGTDLKSDGNEVAVETLEIECEEIVVVEK